jgi:hypothetical protein
MFLFFDQFQKRIYTIAMTLPVFTKKIKGGQEAGRKFARIKRAVRVGIVAHKKVALF